MLRYCIALVFLSASLFSCAQQKSWVEYKGGNGPGKGKHIVFISGDEEYGSEEALPMLAAILSRKYGFDCTILFAINNKGEIDRTSYNIPGLEKLQQADLMFIFVRWRELPDAQMKFIDQYIQAGKPVIGLRTSTHAFNYKKNTNSPYAKYDYHSKVKGWEDGFGKKILGETWVDHHGIHGKEGTRALIEGQHTNNPILNGVKDIWCPTDVYTISKLPADAQVLLYGQCTSGMTATSPVNLNKSVMPVAWTRTYTGDSGKNGRVFASTMGASIDLLNEDLRRLFINACFWTVGLENKIPAKADVDFISEYKPTMFGFSKSTEGLYPSQFELK